MFNRIMFSTAVTSHHVMNIVLPYAHVINACSNVTVGLTDVSLFVVTALSRKKLYVVYRYTEPVLCTDHTHTNLLIYSSY